MKNKLVYVIAVVMFLIFYGKVSAISEVSLYPVNLSVSAGQKVNVNVLINPQNVNNYTFKMVVSYPANILSVSSFSFSNNNWVPLTQSGYDFVDNSMGVITKTAGYPGGFSSSTNFGTITFTALRSGVGTIKLVNDSFSLDSSGQDVLVGEPKSTINIKTVTKTVFVKEKPIEVVDKNIVNPIAINTSTPSVANSERQTPLVASAQSDRVKISPIIYLILAFVFISM